MASERGPFATEFDRWAAGYLSGTTAQVNLVLPPMRAAWQARADLAEQREAELVEAARALSTAVENIDGDLRGVDLVSVYAKADHLDAILAKHKAEGREGS